MDTRFLETFLLVADTSSIVAAARRLNITSAAVAQHIRALEDEIGFPPIMQSGRTKARQRRGRQSKKLFRVSLVCLEMERKASI